MSDQEQISGSSFPSQNLPKGVNLEDPLSPKIHFWLNDLTKTLKGLRVYAENNEMLHKYLAQAYAGLEELLEAVPELSLAVREDRLLYGRDPIHVNADREEGIPFIFFRNAFRRLTFVRGMTKDELFALLKAIATDYTTFDYAGEDLVTALWRLALPHLRYLTIDAISLEAKRARSSDEKEEIDRIQGDIEAIVAAIYNTDAADDDIVAGVTITKEDLEAFKNLEEESEEDLEVLDHATARAIADVEPELLRRLKAELENEDRDELTHRTMDILIRILFRETSSKDTRDTIEILQQLFDSLVLGQRFNHAIRLVTRLKDVGTRGENMQEMHIARHLLKLFSSESRVQPVLNTLGEGYKTATIGEVTDFLRALGADIIPQLLRALDTLPNPAHRRLLCDLIVEFGVPEAADLVEVAKDAKWFVVRDVLSLAQQLPPETVAPLIAGAIRHPHPKVRATAVGMLRGYGRGAADRYLAERIDDDEDLEVRLAAVRVAAARNSAEVKPVLEHVLSDENLSDREPREIRMMTAAFGKIAGTDAVPVLDKILNPGFFASLKNQEAQIAAAYALGAIGTESAMMILQKGSRSISGKVREAVKKALSRVDQTVDLFGETPEDGTKVPSPAQGTRIPDARTEPDAQAPVVRGAIPEATTDVDPLPSRNAADIDFSVARQKDPLEEAPAFSAATTDVAKKSQPVDMHRSGPPVPYVQRPHPEKERVPDRLPDIGLPPPPVNVPPPDATTTRSAPPTAAGTRDVLPDRLPAPAPSAAGSRDVLPDNLPKPPATEELELELLDLPDESDDSEPDEPDESDESDDENSKQQEEAPGSSLTDDLTLD